MQPHTTPPSPVAAWHDLVRRHDPTGIDALLADQVVFWSPVVHKPQQGRAVTTMYLTAAFHVFFNDSFRYVREIVGAQDAVLEFETTIDGIVVNGVDLLRWDDAGRITEFKVMVRPLKAITLIHEKMAAMLASAAAARR
ncbi:MAG: nuclear transport factor 2 family protein [Burkholderiales bacterium]|nr:nuclear transport factor 2 family protein [Burkholderiales bacterium]